MSSNPIPGNYMSVEALVNKLYKAGINVIQNSPQQKLHASGHATQTEQQLMIKLVNPQYVVPIHGEYKMINALRKNAIDAGINPDNIIQVINGQKLNLLNKQLTATEDFVQAYEVYVDGSKVNNDTTDVLKYRRILSQDGIFSVTLIVDRINKKVVELPVLITRGCFYAKTSQPLLTKIAYSIKDNIEQAMNNKKVNITNNEIRKISENTTEFFIWKNKKKKPLVRTTIFDA